MMSGFSGKVRTVLRNRGMLKAYARWLVAKALTARPPNHPIAEGVRIGQWISFSEYWTYSGWSGISEAEKAFGRCSLEARGRASVAVDVGANIGLFTCFLAAAGAGEVHSFEPVAETFCRLKGNVMANQLGAWCHLNCLAVGRACELVTFAVDTKSPGTNRIAPQKGAQLQSGTLLQKVAAIDLDRYCELAGIGQIDFLKIDVEGMECFVLEGAAEIFKANRVCSTLIEVCPRLLEAAGFGAAELYNRILGLGCRPYRLAADGSAGAEFTLSDFQRITCENAALIPD